ncbi:hypothetical protein A3H26_02495 [candidate division WWE3 bacterium RIFCSPLOWO2_12_FULL_36_10]|uniref:Large ribosomal subunit protein bL25 n=1 Tax=candidate division WWE3 bacterium RIFCSPLOWO2_12_FULL_36_10 TaxID=1802630 RepID=A0A1F4VJ59_UNCKA|nr:MAG: hypothetical protein A3H26_02495 [candidate division WWE3 bacterium RIFCSPLOWO2_12_FULL_36_10]
MELIAHSRKEFGKKTKILRRQHKLPAVIYGHGIDSVPVTIDVVNFLKVYRSAGETALIGLKIGDKTEQVLIGEVQLHPVTSLPLHANLHKVDLKEKVTVEVPIKIIGEEESLILKSGEGLLLVLIHDLQVEALPTDLPSEFVIDVSNLSSIGEDIKISFLVYDRKKVEVINADENDTILKIEEPKMAQEEEEVISEQAAVEALEATAEAKEEEGEGEEGEKGQEGVKREPKEKQEKSADKK